MACVCGRNHTCVCGCYSGQHSNDNHTRRWWRAETRVKPQLSLTPQVQDYRAGPTLRFSTTDQEHWCCPCVPCLKAKKDKADIFWLSCSSYRKSDCSCKALLNIVYSNIQLLRWNYFKMKLLILKVHKHMSVHTLTKTNLCLRTFHSGSI